MAENRPDPLAPPGGYDHDAPRGGRRAAQGNYPRPVACNSGPVTGSCRAPMAMIIWYADLAEHVYPVGYCAAHGLAARRLAVRTHCTACGMLNKQVKIEFEPGCEWPRGWYDRAQEAIDGLGARWPGDG